MGWFCLAAPADGSKVNKSIYIYDKEVQYLFPSGHLGIPVRGNDTALLFYHLILKDMFKSQLFQLNTVVDTIYFCFSKIISAIDW